MSRPAAVKHKRKERKSDMADAIDAIALQLCPPEELEAFNNRKHFYGRKCGRGVVMFPVWGRYRKRARRIARLQRMLPFLRRMPLDVSNTLAEILMA